MFVSRQQALTGLGHAIVAQCRVRPSMRGRQAGQAREQVPVFGNGRALVRHRAIFTDSRVDLRVASGVELAVHLRGSPRHQAGLPMGTAPGSLAFFSSCQPSLCRWPATNASRYSVGLQGSSWAYLRQKLKEKAHVAHAH